MAKKSLKRGLAQKIVLSLLTASVMASVLAFEIAEAGDGDFAANGNAMVMDGTGYSNKKIIGGWDLYQSNFDSSILNKVNVDTSITITAGNYDEIIGGFHIKQPHGNANGDYSQKTEALIGNTNVFINGGNIDSVVGGGKVNNSDNTVLTNKNTNIVINGNTIVNGSVIGGNYVKSTGNVVAGTPSKTDAYTNDIFVEINNGEINGNVFGGSVAENYGNVQTNEKPQLTVKDNNIEVTITGGTFKGMIVGGGAAIGNSSVSNVESASMIIAGDNITINDSNGGSRALIFGGSYATNGGVANIKNTGLQIGDDNQNTVLDNGVLRVYAGGFNSGVSGSSSLVLKNFKNQIDPNYKGQFNGGSRYDADNLSSKDGDSTVLINNSVLIGDIRGGSIIFGSNNTNNSGNSYVEVNDTTIDGYSDTNNNTWTGRVFGAGTIDTVHDSSLTQESSTVIINNVGGQTYDKDSGTLTVNDNPGTRIYGGSQLYLSKKSLINVKSTNVEINGEGTALSEVVGGGIISGTITKDNVSTLVTGKTNIIVNNGNITSLLIGGNNTNWFGSSVVGVLNENGVHEYNGYKFNDGETNVILNNGGNGDSLSVIGGSFADYGWYNNQNGKREALVFGNTNVTINGGEALEVVGAGYADYYTNAINGIVNDDAPLSSVIGNTNVVINGGKITENVYGGGFAYSNQEVLASKANLEGNANVTISNGEIGGSVIAGGCSIGNGTEAKVTGTATINMCGGSVAKDIVLGGLTEGETANANVAKAVLNYAGGSIGGTIYSDADTSEINILSGTTLSNAIITESGVSTLKINDGAIWNLTGASSVTKATFGAGSSLVIDGTKFTGNDYAITGKVSMDPTANLVINNAASDTNYKVVKGENNISDSNLSYDRTALVAVEKTDGVYEVEFKSLANATESELTAAQDKAVTANGGSALVAPSIISGAMSPSALAESKALASAITQMAGTAEQKAAIINDIAQIGEKAGNTTNAVNIVNNVTGITNQRLSFTNINTAPQGGHGKVERKYKSGAGVWAQYMHGKDKVDDLPGAGSTTSSYESQYNGAVIGYDFQEVGKTKTGIAFNYGEGDSHSKNASVKTNNDFDFWGVGLYHSIMNEDTNLIFDINYNKTDADVTQVVPGYGKITVNPNTTAISAGVRAEKLIQNGPVQIVPYIGARFLSIDTDEYTSSTGTKFSPDRQNIWLVPVGVSLRQENNYENGWKVTPKADLSYIWALGDTDSSMNVATGVKVDNLAYTVMDNGSFLGTLGIEAEKGDWTYGLSYSYQKGEYQRSDKWFVDVRYSF